LSVFAFLIKIPKKKNRNNSTNNPVVFVISNNNSNNNGCSENTVDDILPEYSKVDNISSSIQNTILTYSSSSTTNKNNYHLPTYEETIANSYNNNN